MWWKYLQPFGHCLRLKRIHAGSALGSIHTPIGAVRQALKAPHIQLTGRIWSNKIHGYIFAGGITQAVKNPELTNQKGNIRSVERYS